MSLGVGVVDLETIAFSLALLELSTDRDRVGWNSHLSML